MEDAIKNVVSIKDMVPGSEYSQVSYHTLPSNEYQIIMKFVFPADIPQGTTRDILQRDLEWLLFHLSSIPPPRSYLTICSPHLNNTSHVAGLFGRIAVKCRRHASSYTYHSTMCLAAERHGVSITCVNTSTSTGTQSLIHLESLLRLSL